MGLNLVGLQAGAGKDKVRALEAERELLELKVALARQALSDVRRLAESVENKPSVVVSAAATWLLLEKIIREANEALEIIGRVE